MNTVLALEIMGICDSHDAGFLCLRTVKRRRDCRFSCNGSRLNFASLTKALQREIAEREKAERHLEVAEQTLQQSSKLRRTWGNVGGRVSHELNQPLAAMKTYLAGAKLLVATPPSRRSPVVFPKRIDDLIERMGAITRQLKSYARKGGDGG